MPSLTWSLLVFAANGTALPSSDLDSAPIDNITVEAAKLPARTTDLSARVTLIDSERMRRELARDIADLVRYEPGVDGVPTSDAFSIGSYSNASRDFVEIDSLKQVEIVRGPASATFGSDAQGRARFGLRRDAPAIPGERRRFTRRNHDGSGRRRPIVASIGRHRSDFRLLQRFRC